MKLSFTHCLAVCLLLAGTLLCASQAHAQGYTDDFAGGRTDFRDEMIYFAMTTRFYDGDPSNNTQCWDNQQANAGDPCWRGDFAGLIAKMDYIKALGFTAIWITPIVTNASGYDYHGYHALDFSTVDRRLESSDVSFQTVVDEAHRRGMKIILDIVLNHTGNFGEEHLCKLFTRDWSANQATIDACMLPSTTATGGPLPSNYLALPGGQQYQARLAQMKNTDGINHDSRNLWHHFSDFNWDLPNRWWAQIAGDCVDLNTENPATYRYLREQYGSFIAMGVDGFRIDTGGHIARLTFCRAFLPYFQQMGERYKTKRLNECPFFMFAEVCARFQGSTTYRSQPCLSPYFYTWASPSKYAWDDTEESWTSLNIPCTSSENFAHQNQRECVREGNDFSQESQFTTRSDNAWLRGNDYHEPDRSQASGLSVIDFPVHYSFRDIGSCWGLFREDNNYNDATFNVVYVDSHDYSPGPNDGIRFNGGTAQWAENLDLMFTFRGIPCLYYGSEIEFRHGSPIDLGPNGPLSNTGRAYFGGYITGAVTPTGFGSYTAASGNVAATLANPLARHIARLSLIRQSVPALRRGQYSTDGCRATSGYAFKRRYSHGATDSYALVSINSGATFTGVLNGIYYDCVSGHRIQVSNGTLTTRAFSGQGQMCVYVLNGPGKIGTDGQYLFATQPVAPQAPGYDGQQEAASDNNGSGTTGGDSGGETPTLPEITTQPHAYFVDEQDWGDVYVWAWNATENFTGGSWPGSPAIKMGQKRDGHDIWLWTYDGQLATSPTMIIFSRHGSPQTADLPFANGAWYNAAGPTTAILSPLAPAATTAAFTITGQRRDPRSLAPGLYIVNGRKRVVK